MIFHDTMWDGSMTDEFDGAIVYPELLIGNFIGRMVVKLPVNTGDGFNIGRDYTDIM